MTRIFYDTEFLEDGHTIGLISIGMVRESDGAELYLVNSDAPWDRIRQNDWLIRNVLPSLPITGRTLLDKYIKVPENSHPKPALELVSVDTTDTRVKPHWVIANEVRDFILATGPNVELWADYGAYDHVALAQLWGPMVKLPEGVPMFTHDIQQERARLGLRWDELPQQESGLHNALADARHNLARARFLDQLAREQSRKAPTDD